MSDPTRCACGGDSGIVETRKTPNGLRRRRRCVDCGARWTTYEVMAGMAVIPRAPKPLPARRRVQHRIVAIRSATPVGKPSE
jgi:transcriptional regulator NrdR family protein